MALCICAGACLCGAATSIISVMFLYRFLNNNINDAFLLPDEEHYYVDQQKYLVKDVTDDL